MKKTLLIRCPISSYSGYGSHSRDVVWQLLKSNKFDINILATKWGILTLGALDENSERNNAIRACIIQPQTRKPKYDYFINISIPNEFERLADINIGFTAGIETDRVAPIWLEKGNVMDAIFVPSHHSKYVYERSKYQKFNKTNNQLVENLECKTPIEVIFEGVDTSIYNNNKKDNIEPLYTRLNDLPTNFNFLCVGHWMQGGMGEDRKDISKLIKTFLNTFEYNNNVGLILKTAIGPCSIPDKYRIIDRIERTLYHMGYNVSKNSPKIYLLHGLLTDEEMALLYSHPKIKSFVTLTHGEGYGRPMAEAAACDLPVIAPNWSGHVDFLNTNYSYLINTQLVQIPQAAVWDGVLEKESMWCNVDEMEASKAMKDVFHNINDWEKKASVLGNEIRSKWNSEKMGELLVDKILNVKPLGINTNVPVPVTQNNPMGIVTQPFKMIK